jgi:hypothetical protein
MATGINRLARGMATFLGIVRQVKVRGRDEFFDAISASVELNLISVKFSAAANRSIGDCQQDAARRLALD